MEKDRLNAIIAGAVLTTFAVGIAATSMACASLYRKSDNGKAPAVVLEASSSEEVQEPVSSEESSSEATEPESSSSETETHNNPTEPEPEDPTDPVDPEPEEPTPEEPEDPTPEEPEPEEPEPEEPEPEEPEEEPIPSIDPSKVYNFKEIKDLLTTYDELNYSYAIIKVRVAGEALGTPGWCFFQDVEDTPINSRSEINNNMSNFLGREDQGNNNAYYTRGDVITISGVVAYEKVAYLGTKLITIK